LNHDLFKILIDMDAVVVH